MLCIGHRGARGHEPENTLLSVEKAISLGASWIEVDVRYVDDRLVVIHDARLERTTNGTGAVYKQTFDYLRSLDAGKGQKIPTLEEVFAATQGSAGLVVDLKDSETVEPVLHLIREQVARGWKHEHIIVSSFNHRDLVAVKRLAPKVLIGALLVGLPVDNALFAERLDCYSVHVSVDYIDKSFVEDAHRRGLKVFVFMVNEPEDIRRMELLRVDGLFTDYPDRAAASLRSEE
jgi:glycerophosphoryl diester phosphodiesterase